MQQRESTDRGWPDLLLGFVLSVLAIVCVDVAAMGLLNPLQDLATLGGYLLVNLVVAALFWNEWDRRH